MGESELNSSSSDAKIEEAKKLWLAIAAAAAFTLTSSFLMGCIFVAVIASEHRHNTPFDLQTALDGFSIAFDFAYFSSFLILPAIFILSAPLHRLALRIGRSRGQDYAVVGTFVGEAVCLAVETVSQQLTGCDILGPMGNPALVIAPLLGAIAALAFWVVSRPDKQAPKTTK